MGRRRAVKVVAVIGLAIIFIGVIIMSVSIIPEEVQSNYNGTSLTISTKYDYLDYRPTYVSTRLGDWYAEFSFESEERFLAFDNYDNYTYLSYIDDDEIVSTAIVICEDIPEQLQLTTMDKIKIKATKFTDAYTIEQDDGEYISRTTYKSMYGIGYLIVIQQEESKYKDENKMYTDKLMQSLLDSITFSRVDEAEKSFKIDIEGFDQQLDVDKLSFIDGNGGVFFGQDRILRIYNFKEDKTYGFIACANNAYLMNYTDDMQVVEGKNNLYYNKGIDDESSMGYRLFGIQTPMGYYDFKASDDAPQSFEEEILNALDFDSMSSEIILGSVANSILENSK